jgi:hypothetical protein
MVIRFADNQSLVCVHGTPAIIYTDWVPMGANDRLSAQSNLHSLVKTGSGTPSLVYLAQVSNDGGQNPVPTVVTDTLEAVGIDSVVGAANGALVRFKFTLSLTSSSSGDIAAACFDLHVNLDHV